MFPSKRVLTPFSYYWYVGLPLAYKFALTVDPSLLDTHTKESTNHCHVKYNNFVRKIIRLDNS